MKTAVIPVILMLLLLNPVTAKTIEEIIYREDNIEVPGYNITLLTVDANKKSIVACINNEKYIINRNSRKEIGFLKVEPTRIYEDYARLKITYSCEECSCDESCSNNLCYNQQAQEQKNEVPNENNAIINKENTNQKSDNTILISLILFMIVTILIIILLLTRRKKHKKRGR